MTKTKCLNNRGVWIIEVPIIEVALHLFGWFNKHINSIIGGWEYIHVHVFSTDVCMFTSFNVHVHVHVNQTSKRSALRL